MSKIEQNLTHITRGNTCNYCCIPSKRLCMNCANENGFSIIRILQDDVFKDKYEWLDELMKNIEMLKADSVINIYMSKGNEYDCFNSIKSGL